MRKSALLAACLWAGWSASPASAIFLYGMSNSGDIYKINQSTGTRDLFMTGTGVQWLDAADGLTLTTFFATGNNGLLYEIDVQAQTVTAIGAYGGGAVVKVLAYAEPATPGGTGVLYGSDFQNMYTINVNTGAATLVGPIHGGDYFIGVWSMDYDPVADRLYITNQLFNSSKLYYVDPGTALATLVAPVQNATMINDLWYDHDTGKMLAMEYGAAQLYEMNTTNAQLTMIGTPLIGSERCVDIMGLGTVAPDPASGLLFLAASGLTGMIVRRRR